MSEPTGAPALSKLTDSELEQEYIRLYLSLTEPQRQKLDQMVRCFTDKNEEVSDD